MMKKAFDLLRNNIIYTLCLQPPLKAWYKDSCSAYLYFPLMKTRQLQGGHTGHSEELGTSVGASLKKI